MNVCINAQIIDRFLHGITPRFRWNFQRVLPESCDILSLLCHVMNDKKKVHTVHRLIWATNVLVWEAQRKWIRNGPNTLPGSSVLFWATNGTDGTSWKWSLRRSLVNSWRQQDIFNHTSDSKGSFKAATELYVTDFCGNCVTRLS